MREIGALKGVLGDEDWQVRFNAAAALEALGQTAALKGQPLALTAGTSPFEGLGRGPLTPEVRTRLHQELSKPLPDVLALRAAGIRSRPRATATAAAVTARSTASTRVRL